MRENRALRFKTYLYLEIAEIKRSNISLDRDNKERKRINSSRLNSNALASLFNVSIDARININTYY